MIKYYDCGIDLGTTNSCIAIPGGERGFEILNNTATNSPVTPSAVYRRCIKGEKSTIVGDAAFRSSDVKSVAREFKRIMGSDKTIRFEKAGEEWNAEDLSAEVLKELVIHANQRTERKLEDVVITVPARFTILQNEATVRAGKLAGFRNVELLQEPIAASIAYGMQPETDNQYWLVFDWGGGTLDAAVVSTFNGRLKVVNCDGDNYLGGIDIDRAIVNKIILPQLKSEYEINEKNQFFMRKIILEAEKCKKELSTNQSSVFSASYEEDPRAFVDIGGEPIEFSYTVTLNEYENVIMPLVEKAIQKAANSLEEAKVSAERLEKVILVGGTTFIPLVRTQIEKRFGVPVEYSINPMTVVAAGAAIYAGRYSTGMKKEDTFSLDFDVLNTNIQYDRVSRTSSAKVLGKIIPKDGKRASEFKIDVFGDENHMFSLSSTGWLHMTNIDTGFFTTMIELPKSGDNYLTLIARDENGSTLRLSDSEMVIAYDENAKKLDNAPLNYTIGVKAMEGGRAILQSIIPKNAAIPTEGIHTFATTKELDPESDEKLVIEVYAGEIIEFPIANTKVETVAIPAKTIGRRIPKDTEVWVKIGIDRNGTSHFSAGIDSIGFELPDRVLRSGIVRENINEKLDQVLEEKRVLKKTVKELEQTEAGGSWQSRLDILEKRYQAFKDSSDVNIGDAHQFLTDFYQFYLEVDAALRKTKKAENNNLNKDEEIIEEAEIVVDKTGTYDEKALLKDLIKQYREADREIAKDHFIQRIDNLKFCKQIEDFDWLERTFVRINHSAASYKDDMQAAFWKQEGKEAVETQNVPALRNAIFKLLDNMVFSTDVRIDKIKADLRIMVK